MSSSPSSRSEAPPNWPPDPRRRWVTLADSGAPPDADYLPLSRRRVLLPVVLGACLVLVLVALTGSAAARRLAEKEAVADAARHADVLADAVVQPALEDGLLHNDPAAFAELDEAVRDHVLPGTTVRVKIWTEDGRIVYSDVPALVGETFDLPPEHRAAFSDKEVRAEVSELSGRENRYEEGEGRLLEVYRPVWTPGGETLLFEVYSRYDAVTDRAGELWRGFAAVTLTSLLALIVLLLPVLWQLTARLRRVQQQREALVERAVEASIDERRRIAGNLHDGVIQDLAGASLTVSSAAARAAAADQPDLAATLRNASTTVRAGITSMRSLLVDIYPPNLETAGLDQTLEGLAVGLRGRDVDVRLDLDPAAARRLDLSQQQLVYRVAHETLRNASQHARARNVRVSLSLERSAVLLEISDDGAGFDAEQARTSPERGHFGLQVLADVALDAGADLAVASAPGEGTRWVLRIPTAAPAPRTSARPRWMRVRSVRDADMVGASRA